MRRGSAILEFSLAGIPLIFVLVSTFEMARGMWIYHSLAHAVKTGARFASLHGANCWNPGNSCRVDVAAVARNIASAGTGLPPDAFSVTLTSIHGSVNCNPLRACFGNGAPWPPPGENESGMDIRISAVYNFRSALALFWPGAGSVRFATARFCAYSRQRVQF